MSQDNNNGYPRDFRVIKNEREKEVHIEQEQDNNFEEETSMEYAPPINRADVPYDTDGEEVREGGRGMATLALILSIASLLFWHILLGAVGLILGFMAVGRGHKGLGYTAIAIGAFSIIMSLFSAPFITY